MHARRSAIEDMGMDHGRNIYQSSRVIIWVITEIFGEAFRVRLSTKIYRKRSRVIANQPPRSSQLFDLTSEFKKNGYKMVTIWSFGEYGSGRQICKSLKTWCPGPESNRHGAKLQGILSPLCLPIPPPGHEDWVHIEWGENVGGDDRIWTGDKGFADLRLTTWLRRRIKNKRAGIETSALCYGSYGAGNGIWTRDPRLGKAMLYHWAIPALLSLYYCLTIWCQILTSFPEWRKLPRKAFNVKQIMNEARNLLFG